MERPLSPFMFPTWYRFQFTSVLSILHRFTGVVLSVGSILLIWWLVAAVVGGSLAPLIGALLLDWTGTPQAVAVYAGLMVLAEIVCALLSRETRGANLTSPARKPYSSMVSMFKTIAE